MADTKPTADEIAAYEQGAAASRNLVQTVQHGGLAEKTIAQLADEISPSDVTQVLVTKPFTLNTDKGKRIKFPIGLQRCPTALLDHWYVKAHNVQAYDMKGPAPDNADVIVVPSDMPHEIEIGDRKVSITELTLSTVRNLGLSAGIWNALPDADKRQLIQDKIRVSQDAEAAKAAAGAAGKGDEKVKAAPATHGHGKK
jgi:hypothetical protein